MAIKNKEKPKAKTGSTALQEQGSLVALYYAYKKGANLNNGNGNKASKTAQLELDVALKKVYPAMNKAWYETFISQAKAICNYKLCKHSIGTKTNAIIKVLISSYIGFFLFFCFITCYIQFV